MINFIGDPLQFSADVESLILGKEPFFFSRIGGSDTDAVIDYIASKNSSNPEAFEKELLEHLATVQRYNGFYAKADLRENFSRYLETLISSYKGLNRGTICGGKLISIYYPKVIHPSLRKFHSNIERTVGFFDEISEPWRKLDLYPYNRIENIGHRDSTLISSLAKTLNGKRVLVVSPFAESILFNYHRRNSFFKEVKFPEIELAVVNTPITYYGLPDELYPHGNWFETVDELNKIIASEDFDIALLSCGSYALPIGDFIKNKMRRGAIYVGGVLQLFFGVMGRRYDSIFFTQHINQENFIYPIERQKYLSNKIIPESMAKEAFGAYF